MKLKSTPTFSDKTYLADIDPDFKRLEGDVEHDCRVWVIVRQGTEDDNHRRADLVSKRERKWNYDKAGKFESASDVYDENFYQRRMLEVYLTLVDLGNDDDSTFKYPPKEKMSLSDFERVWGGLDPVVCSAIHSAVLKLNADWGGLFPNQ